MIEIDQTKYNETKLKDMNWYETIWNEMRGNNIKWKDSNCIKIKWNMVERNDMKYSEKEWKTWYFMKQNEVR